jgi:hypothetical protein
MIRKLILVKMVGIIAALVVFCAPAGADATPPYAYAFAPSAIPVKQAQVRKFFPAAVCKGKIPVDLVGDGRGYLVILCVDELDGPVQIRFRINNKGYIITEYLWGDER